MHAAYHRARRIGYSLAMVSPARRRRAQVLLLLTWAVIAGVLGARYIGGRREANVKLDREAREQEALARMEKMVAPAADAVPDAGNARPVPDGTIIPPQPLDPSPTDPKPEPEG